MFDIADTIPWLVALKEIVVIVAAAVGAYVAWYGLGAWKRQMSGKAEYDIAVQYLRAVLRLRNAIGVVRFFSISTGEMVHLMRESQEQRAENDPEKDQAYAAIAAYESQWKAVVEANSDLQIAALEAEVVWGREPIDLLVPLRKCVNELHWAIDVYLRERYRDSRDRDDKLYADVLSVIFWASDDPTKDAFSGKVNGAVSAAEQFVRPHLGWKHRV